MFWAHVAHRFWVYEGRCICEEITNALSGQRVLRGETDEPMGRSKKRCRIDTSDEAGHPRSGRMTGWGLRGERRWYRRRIQAEKARCGMFSAGRGRCLKNGSDRVECDPRLELFTGGLRAFLSLLRPARLHYFAQLAGMLAVQRHLDGLGKRGGLGVGDNHARPRDRLHQTPMHPH